MKNLSLIILVFLFITLLSFFICLNLSPDILSRFLVVNSKIILFFKKSGILEETDINNSMLFSKLISSKNGQIIIKNNIWNVEIVDKENDLMKGLSNRKTLYANKGMLFVFEKEGAQSFWMKDMLIPIDMIFFDADWKIVLIESNIQTNTFPKLFGGNVKSKYVLEINALESKTYDLKAGDQAVFLNK